jgi:REP element-mobilizing transposase RayT
VRRGPTEEAFGKPTKGSIPTIIRSYKSAVTKKINEINNQQGDKVWQPNYYECVIRNKKELNRIRVYIRKNPENWKKDYLNTRL